MYIAFWFLFFFPAKILCSCLRLFQPGKPTSFRASFQFWHLPLPGKVFPSMPFLYCRTGELCPFQSFEVSTTAGASTWSPPAPILQLTVCLLLLPPNKDVKLEVKLESRPLWFSCNSVIRTRIWPLFNTPMHVFMQKVYVHSVPMCNSVTTLKSNNCGMSFISNSHILFPLCRTCEKCWWTEKRPEQKFHRCTVTGRDKKHTKWE